MDVVEGALVDVVTLEVEVVDGADDVAEQRQGVSVHWHTGLFKSVSQRATGMPGMNNLLKMMDH